MVNFKSTWCGYNINNVTQKVEFILQNLKIKIDITK